MKFCKDIKKGDIIVVSYTNLLVPAIFLELGFKGNPRFHFISDFKLKRLREGRKPYIDYITRKSDNSIAKVSVDSLEDNIKDMYLEIAELLTKAGQL